MLFVTNNSLYDIQCFPIIQREEVRGKKRREGKGKELEKEEEGSRLEGEILTSRAHIASSFSNYFG